MDKRRIFATICCILAYTVLIFLGGCKSKEEPVQLTVNIEGQNFSNAELSIDGKSLGRLTQTVIKSNGELYIDGVLSATLPPGSPQRTEEDVYSGALDSIRLKQGDHTITLLASEGESFQIAATVSPGYHLMTYSQEKGTIKWDNETFKAIPGETITVKPKTGK